MSDTTTTPRPLVDFSGSSRATAREYAAAANSRVLSPTSQETLAAAAKGEAVDAYALNEAVTDAMRAASTRLGQSMARRDLGRKVAYLGHITQAVLENHADGLPVYADTGVRSRKIEDQARIIDSHQGRIRDLEADLARATAALDQAQAANDEVRRALETAEGGHAAYRAAADDEISRLLALANVRDLLLAETVRERDSWAAVVSHVLDNIDPEGKIRLLGYIDGHQDASGI